MIELAVGKTLEVRGMTCRGCENAVRNALRRLGGVIKAEPDHRADRVDVRFDPDRVSEEDVKDRIRSAGYDVP